MVIKGNWWHLLTLILNGQWCVMCDVLSPIFESVDFSVELWSVGSQLYPFVPGYLRTEVIHLRWRWGASGPVSTCSPGGVLRLPLRDRDLVPGTGAKAACVGHQVAADWLHALLFFQKSSAWRMSGSRPGLPLVNQHPLGAFVFHFLGALPSTACLPDPGPGVHSDESQAHPGATAS